MTPGEPQTPAQALMQVRELVDLQEKELRDRVDLDPRWNSTENANELLEGVLSNAISSEEEQRVAKNLLSMLYRQWQAHVDTLLKHNNPKPSVVLMPYGVFREILHRLPAEKQRQVEQNQDRLYKKWKSCLTPEERRGMEFLSKRKGKNPNRTLPVTGRLRRPFSGPVLGWAAT